MLCDVSKSLLWPSAPGEQNEYNKEKKKREGAK